jgi:hypothetical protein
MAKIAIGSKTKRRERGIMVRAIVPPDIAKKLIDMAAKDGRTLSAMIARILMKAVDKES